jgi:hypothetical protein
VDCRKEVVGRLVITCAKTEPQASQPLDAPVIPLDDVAQVLHLTQLGNEAKIRRDPSFRDGFRIGRVLVHSDRARAHRARLSQCLAKERFAVASRFAPDPSVAGGDRDRSGVASGGAGPICIGRGQPVGRQSTFCFPWRAPDAVAGSRMRVSSAASNAPRSAAMDASDAASVPSSISFPPGDIVPATGQRKVLVEFAANDMAVVEMLGADQHFAVCHLSRRTTRGSSAP